MKKIGLALGLVVLLIGGYLTTCYRFELNESQVGRIEIRSEGWERIPLSAEEASTLVHELNQRQFRLFSQDLKSETDEAGYTYPPTQFRLFVFDKQGNSMADIRIYDEKNLSYKKEIDGSFHFGYHATQGTLDLNELAALTQ